MALILSEAEESDVERIAEIHMAAFGPNALLQAQFPTSAIREELRACIAEKALADIRDPKTAVLVVRDGNEIISFTKWSLPVLESEMYQEPPWRWPEGTDLELLEKWTGKVEEAQKRVLGNGPCYHLSFIGTHPQHERRGAASKLVKWAIDRCEKEGMPAYLEGTRNALQFYKRLGFVVVETVSAELKGWGTHNQPLLYEEDCLLFRPGFCRGNDQNDNPSR